MSNAVDRSAPPAFLDRFDWQDANSAQYSQRGDNDSSLSIIELDRYLKSALNIELSDEKLNALFDVLDHNGSGAVRQREMESSMDRGDFNLFHRIDSSDGSIGQSDRPSNPERVQNPSSEETDPVSKNRDRGGSIEAEISGPVKVNAGQTREFDRGDADYVIYVESHGKHGHGNMHSNHRGMPEVTEGLKLVEVKGGQDKYIALYEVTESQVRFRDDEVGAGHLFLVKTDQRIEVKGGDSLDPSYNGDPNNGKVLGPDQSDRWVLYAEDENGKNGGRRGNFLTAHSSEQFYSGQDDAFYVIEKGDMPDDDRKALRGNGAFMEVEFSD